MPPTYRPVERVAVELACFHKPESLFDFFDYVFNERRNFVVVIQFVGYKLEECVFVLLGHRRRSFADFIFKLTDDALRDFFAAAQPLDKLYSVDLAFSVVNLTCPFLGLRLVIEIFLLFVSNRIWTENVALPELLLAVCQKFPGD